MAKPRRFNALLWVVLPLVLLFIGMGVAAGIKSGERSPGDVASQACHSAVSLRLKAPATAAFHGDLISVAGDRYTVEGMVDAENSFGAMMRNSYRCTVDVDGEGGSVASVSVG